MDTLRYGYDVAMILDYWRTPRRQTGAYISVDSNDITTAGVLMIMIRAIARWAPKLDHR